METQNRTWDRQAARLARRMLLLGAVLLGVALPLSAPDRGAAARGAGARGAATDAVHVLRVSPANGTDQTPRATPVVIFFDRPMVSLTAIETPAAAPAVRFTPSIPGHGRWLNTATWAWYPDPALHGATRYTVTVPAGLRAVDGTVLPTAYQATFSTVRPTVARVRPADGARYADFRAPITVRFNQSMNQASVAAAFTLRDAAGRAIAGTFSWPRPDMLLFHPATGLTPGARYSVAVGSSIRSAEGTLPAGSGASWSFTTAAAPILVTSTSPANGAPSGDISQGLQIHLNAPVDPRLVRARLRVSPHLPGMSVEVSDDGLTAYVYGNYAPSTRYQVTLDGVVGTYGQSLQPLRLSFTTPPLAPAVQFVYSDSIVSFDAYRPIDVAVRGLNTRAVHLALYPLSRQEFLGLLHSYDLQDFVPSAGAIFSAQPATIAPLNKTATIGQELPGAGGKGLRPGFYFLQARGVNGGSDQMAFMVTRTALTFKVSASARRVLVWATDLHSGRPLAGLPVQVVRLSTGALVGGGRTGPDGVLDTSYAFPPAQDDLAAVLSRPGDASLCSANWGSGVQPYDYNLPAIYGPTPSRLGYLYTDRPIYRPGEAVRFRGLVRRDDDGAYGLPVPGTPVRVTLTNALGRVVYNSLVHLDGYGAFNGTVKLAAKAALGYGNLTAQIGSQAFGVSFQIADYRKPDYTVAASPARASGNYTTGERVRVTVAARYLFGAPLKDARVHWSVLSSPLYFTAPAYPDYTFQDYPYIPFIDYGGAVGPAARGGPGADTRIPGYPAPAGGAGVSSPCYGCGPGAGPTLVAQGNARTDARGNLTLSIPANLQHDRLSQQWSVEADVFDITNASISGRTLVSVHKGLFYVGLRGPSALVVAGRPARISLLTIGQDGTTLAPRVPLTMKLYRRTYRTVTINGLPQLQPVDTLLRTFSAATGANGHGSARVTLPSSGEFRLVAEAHDARGNLVRSAISLYAVTRVSGADEAASPWANTPQDRIRLVPDKTLYHVGDVARVLVAAPRPGMTALVTIERGRVYSHRVVRFTSASPVLRVPIPARYLPDVFISVVLVAGTGPHAGAPLWKMGVAELLVDVRARQLRLTLRAPTRAAPGQRITVHLHAALPDGLPAQGQFSLAMVDEGVLALAAEQAPAILDAFYAERGLGVQTAYSQNVRAYQLSANAAGLGQRGRENSVARAAAPVHKAAAGGGGGGGVGPGAKIRAYFPDTAYWNPSVTTGADGNATVTLTLPDSLTTWRLTARGLTRATVVGQTSRDVVSTRDLLLRPLAPRFLTLDDAAQVGAAVNNTTGRTLSARVTLTVHGAGSIAGVAPQPVSVTVPPGGERLVTWPVRPSTLGTVSLLLRVSAPGVSGDAVLVSAPVEPNSTPETVASSGEVGASRLESVTVPAAAQPGEGGLTLTLQPSLAAGLRSSGDYLQHYPFESSEDLAARIMGEVALTRLPPSATGVSAATLAAYRHDITSAITLLLAMQRGDGGWGWWIGDLQSSPSITAFCLDALDVARGAGYPVFTHGTRVSVSAANSYIAAQAQRAAVAPLAGPTGEDTVPPDLRPYLAYLLDADSSGNNGAGTALFPARDNLPLWSRAYLLRALYLEDNNRLSPRGRTVLAELEAGAHLDAAGAHWESSGDDATMDDPIHATAVVLDALIQVDPKSPLIAPATRWLVSARSGDAWQTTVDNAVALQALSDGLRASGELVGHYSYVATIGGRTWGSGTVTPATLATSRVLTTPVGNASPLDLPPGSTTRVGMTRSNTSGRLYYTLRLSYYPRVDTVQPLERGVAITRAYLYNGQPVTSAPAGAVLQVRLTVTAAQDLYYVNITDPLPAGAEAVDPTLLTTSQLHQGGYRVPRGTSDLAWYVSHTELRDDEATLFAPYLPAGVYRYQYAIHLTTPGVFHALPAHAAETYFPEVFGHSAGGYLTVR